MNDQEIEQAFQKAQDEWLEENKGVAYNNSQQRYFFFAGAEFGAVALGQTLTKAGEIEGTPV